jgi:hypothetical protein
MMQNNSISTSARNKLDKVFNFSIEDAFARNLQKVTDREISINILGVGGSVSPGGGGGDIGATLGSRCDVITKFIEDNIDDPKYFLLFDELYEDYKGVLLNTSDAVKYRALMVRLFKAAQEVHSYFKGREINVFPVVFLRDDIFDLLEDHDKPKWSDKAVDLNWDSLMLRDLVAYRINRARGLNSESVEFLKEWRQIFGVERTKLNVKRRYVDTISYLIKSTYLRPRDLISYIRECANVALSHGAVLVDNAMIKEAEVRHSEFMRRELIAEVYSIIPEISEILDMFSEIRKHIFTRKEFNDNYRNLRKRLPDGSAHLPEHKVLDLLYYFGAIGNVTRGAHQVFKYNSPRSKLNRRENICIHRSLLKSVDIY